MLGSFWVQVRHRGERWQTKHIDSDARTAIRHAHELLDARREPPPEVQIVERGVLVASWINGVPVLELDA